MRFVLFIFLNSFVVHDIVHDMCVEHLQLSMTFFQMKIQGIEH